MLWKKTDNHWKKKYKEDLNESDLNTENYKRKILGYITIIEDYLSKIKRNVDENDLIQCAITSYDVESDSCRLCGRDHFPGFSVPGYGKG